MKRIQLFEFEDFSWFPDVFRTSMTNLIVVLHKVLGTNEVMLDLLSGINKEHPFNQITDLGSGSGGMMPEVVLKMNDLNPDASIKLLLTDLHSNPMIIDQINAANTKYVRYSEVSVDATDLKKTYAGLKTMVNSFHHIPPREAKKILKSAQENLEPLLIYEMGENFVPTLLWWILLPLSLTILIIMSLLMTPFVKPLRWRQLLFTYLIPIVPFCYAWDGQASTVRTYTFNDIELLLEDARSDSYFWRVSHAKKRNGKKLGYFILGLPK